MKTNHKPYTKLQAKRGRGQKALTNFKSREEYKEEISRLENTRFAHYIQLNKDIQLIELEYKNARLSAFYVNHEETKILTDTKYKQKRAHCVASYNEIVRPIDKQLTELRLEARERFPYATKSIDERLVKK